MERHYPTGFYPLPSLTQTLPLREPLKNWVRRSKDSQSHHSRLVVDGNITYRLKHNVGKYQINLEKYEHSCKDENLNMDKHKI
jgi:hypothetical protein